MKKMAGRVCLLLILLLLSLDQRAFALQRYLKVAVDCNLPPYQFLTAEGEMAGLHIDMLKAIAEEEGFILEYVPLETGQACMEALEAGKADLALGVIQGERRAQSVYTEPLSNGTLCMIAANDHLPQRPGVEPVHLHTAVFSADTTQNSLLSNLDFHRYIVVGNQRQVFERRRALSAAALIGIKESLLYQIEESGGTEDYTILRNYLDTINYSIAVQRQDTELLRTLNDEIVRFKASSRYAAVHDSWIARDSSERLTGILKSIAIVAVVIAAIVLCYGWFTARMRRVLQRQVDRQTHELQDSKLQLERQLSQIQDENDLRNRIIKYSPNAMVLFDSAYCITLMNRSACAMTGVSPQEPAGNVLDLPVFRDILRETQEDIFAAGTVIANRSLRLDSGGDYHSYRYTMHQIVLYGEISLILLTVLDATKEDKAQQEAFEKEKSRTLNRVVAGIAHEIRNPLTSISTFATLIGSDGGNRQVQESFATYVPREVERINRLIEDLIHYAKPASRHMEPMDVTELAGAGLYLLKPLMEKGHILFTQSCEPGLFILADRDQIKQVLINLLMNGIEAIEKRRARQPDTGALSMHLAISGAGEEVLLCVRDEGIGMTAVEIERCTEPFFTTKDTGTGLGLALCQQYVIDNGGTLSIRSAEMNYTEITLKFRRVDG